MNTVVKNFIFNDDFNRHLRNVNYSYFKKEQSLYANYIKLANYYTAFMRGYAFSGSSYLKSSNPILYSMDTSDFYFIDEDLNKIHLRKIMLMSISDKNYIQRLVVDPTLIVNEEQKKVVASIIKHYKKSHIDIIYKSNILNCFLTKTPIEYEIKRNDLTKSIPELTEDIINNKIKLKGLKSPDTECVVFDSKIIEQQLGLLRILYEVEIIE